MYKAELFIINLKLRKKEMRLSFFMWNSEKKAIGNFT